MGVSLSTKSNDMKKSLLSILTILLVVILSSCSDNTAKKLLGTWKVDDVKTEFNETEVTPEMLKQVVEMQKQTYFRIVNDSTMVIISSNNTHEAKWLFNPEENTIIYFFNGMETTPNTLGKFEDGQIINETSTPLGSMVIYYKKQ